MIVDPTVLPGFLLLLAELVALAGVGFIVVRVALRQTDDRMALAQGMVVGLALWGLITNLVLYAVPGLAGAAIGWGVTLALGAVLAWRAPERIRPEPRMLAGFAAVVLALLWAGLASRQLLVIPDDAIHLGLAATLRAGGFPPELPWSPGIFVRYHHGIDLLIGLLTPPVGPDLAFVTELMGVYAWTSFVLIVVTALASRASWPIALLLAPLMLSTSLWTWQGWAPGILQGPVPAGLPAAGLRASLAQIYWPTAELPLSTPFAALPDIWKPSFTMAYALAVVVLERVARDAVRSWPATLTLAGLVGFMGLVSTTLAPVVLVLWAGLEAIPLAKAWRATALTWRRMLRPGVGLGLAVALLLIGGGKFTELLDGSASSGLVFWWDGDPRNWQLLGTLDVRPGGMGLLEIGAVVVAGIGVLLARRDRLVLALAVGAAMLAVAWLVLRYEPYPIDLKRLAGHARNFALLAMLLALSPRLAALRPRWRIAAGTLLLSLVIWPTAVGPVRYVGLALGQGVDLANAGSLRPAISKTDARGRSTLPVISTRVAAHIRDHTAVDARVLVPEWPYLSVTYATGRPNAAGYPNVRHLLAKNGPEFVDARHYLEPAALRRLGFDYIYATDDWIAGLPDRARRWLADPALFELLVRDGAEALYRVRPAFLALEVSPSPASFEALRQAVPAGTMVYWPSGAPFETETTLRVASVLSPDARLFGVLTYMRRKTYALTPMSSERLGDQTPDLVIVPVGLDPWMFPPESRQPIWWNDEMAVYAPHGAMAPVMQSPDVAPPEPPPISVRASDVRAANGRMAFTLTVDDHSPDLWSGQDWVLLSVDKSPWAIPRRLESDQRTPVVEQWFAGQIVRGRGATTHAYVYDAASSTLAVRSGDGAYRTEASSAGVTGPGRWTLALRLLREVDRGAYVTHEHAAVIPVLNVTVSEDGAIVYEIYDDLLDP